MSELCSSFSNNFELWFSDTTNKQRPTFKLSMPKLTQSNLTRSNCEEGVIFTSIWLIQERLHRQRRQDTLFHVTEDKTYTNLARFLYALFSWNTVHISFVWDRFVHCDNIPVILVICVFICICPKCLISLLEFMSSFLSVYSVFGYQCIY